ncbi:MAG: hypothetical protein FWE58_06180, partial [Methanobrevibacter sp.]|nr:hypothetical protein [Methanobrevibacter sp.]
MKIIKNNNHNILFVFLAILFVFTVIINVPNVDATNYTVDTNGNDSAGGISSPFKSVGRAIDVTNNGVGGDNITINAGTYKSSEGHNVSNLTISKNVNIYSAKYLGKSGLDTILDGEKKGWFFYINPGVTVNIYGIIFKNGNGTLGGGISSDRGVCNLNNVSFINCTSASGGGAIYVGDGSINIIASNFENNTVGQDSSGGAIYVDGGSVNLIACNFTANNANAGGAVFIFTNNNVEIVDCIFKNNVANNNGGAILFFKSNNVRVSNSSFTNNNGYVGGAIRIEDSNVDVIACNFTVNYVNSVGGAICIEGGNVKLSDSIFTGNKGNVGGAVLIWEGNNVNLINCTFEYNTANYGGAVCVEDDNVNIINSTFNENNASIAGGAIYIGANNVKVSGSNFTGNIANGADYGGGAICVDDGNIEVINSSFIGNRGKYGGAIFMANYNVKVSGSIFIGNNAEYGGAIFVNSGTCTINYSIILNNTNNQIYRNNNGIIFADYNWWANHNNPQSQVFGFELNNWFVMGLNKVTTEVSVGGNFVFNYHFSLFNKVYGTTSFNAGVGNFPHFDFILTYNGAVIHLSDTDARFNKTGLTVVVNKTIGNTITASAFNREITHLSFEAIRHRTAIVVQDTNGNYGENIVLRANLSFFN